MHTHIHINTLYIYYDSESVSCSVVPGSVQTHKLWLARLLCPWDSPGKNTRVGRHSLLHGIFPTQGSNMGLLHCRQILYCLSHQHYHTYDYIKYNMIYVNPHIDIYIYICIKCLFVTWLKIRTIIFLYLFISFAHFLIVSFIFYHWILAVLDMF